MTMNATSPLRFGILGTARIATKLAAAIRDCDSARLHSIASRDLGRAESWASRHEAEHARGSYDELLEDEELDAVYVPLPPSMHAEWAVRAARAGKHVLCEKPLAANATDAERIVTACRDSGVHLMDATMWLHAPRTGDMERHLHSGEMGPLRRVTAAVGIDVEGYMKNNPAAPHDPELRLTSELGGGSLLDLGWYGVGAAQWAYGEMPTRVFATSRRRHGVDVNTSAILWYTQDRMASFDCGFDAARRKWFEIVGTRGSIVCDDYVGPWDVAKQRFWSHDAEMKPTEHASPPRRQELCMVERFCTEILSGERNPAWEERALQTQRILDALALSAAEERVVELT